MEGMVGVIPRSEERLFISIRS